MKTLKVSSTECQKALSDIERVTEGAANTVRECFKDGNIDTYIHFLDTMYHYTLNTGQKASEAAKNIKTLELKNFFIAFEKEEHWHYRLAVHDLKAFGKIPSNSAPYVIKAFDDFWFSLSDKHYNGYLGALYVFENIAKYLGDDITEYIRNLGLSRKETAWLSTHAEEDIEHGKLVEEMLKKHIAENPSLAVSSAKEASKLWENIMVYAFSPIATQNLKAA